MNIDFCNFSKKKNSTKIPAPATYHTIGCTLKDASSVSNPTILLLKNDYDLSWNYCHIGYFDRYYFVRDITVNGNIINISLSEDILASNRTGIFNTTAFIEYCADSAEVMIPDSRLTMQPNFTYDESLADLPSFIGSEHIYILSVIGKNTSGTPFNQHYYLTTTAVNSLVDKMMDADFITKLKNQFTDAYNCILSLKYLPLNPAYLGLVNTTVILGKEDTEIGGRILTNTVYNSTTQIIIPWIYDSDFRQLEPYTTIKLYLPYVGYVDISPSDVFQFDRLYIDTVVSITSRQITYRIRCTEESENKYIAIYSSHIGYELPVSTYHDNAVGTALTVAGSATAVGVGAITKNIKVAAAGVSALSNLTNTLQSTASQIGDFNGAGMEKFGLSFAIVVTSHLTEGEPSTARVVIGRPYMKISQIGSHTGYVQCNNASVDIDALDDELMQINDFLNTGVYIE